jgi:hypothetical protein
MFRSSLRVRCVCAGPEFLTMSEVEMWFTWGHGNEVTVYANDYLPLLESDRGF